MSEAKKTCHLGILGDEVAAKVSPFPQVVGFFSCGDMVRLVSPGDLHAFFFFRGNVFIGKETMGNPKSVFLFAFFEQKFIQMVDFNHDVESWEDRTCPENEGSAFG